MNGWHYNTEFPAETYDDVIWWDDAINLPVVTKQHWLTYEETGGYGSHVRYFRVSEAGEPTVEYTGSKEWFALIANPLRPRSSGPRPSNPLEGQPNEWIAEAKQWAEWPLMREKSASAQ